MRTAPHLGIVTAWLAETGSRYLFSFRFSHIVIALSFAAAKIRIKNHISKFYAKNRAWRVLFLSVVTYTCQSTKAPQIARNELRLRHTRGHVRGCAPLYRPVTAGGRPSSFETASEKVAHAYKKGTGLVTKFFIFFFFFFFITCIHICIRVFFPARKNKKKKKKTAPL